MIFKDDEEDFHCPTDPKSDQMQVLIDLRTENTQRHRLTILKEQSHSCFLTELIHTTLYSFLALLKNIRQRKQALKSYLPVLA